MRSAATSIQGAAATTTVSARAAHPAPRRRGTRRATGELAPSTTRGAAGARRRSHPRATTGRATWTRRAARRPCRAETVRAGRAAHAREAATRAGTEVVRWAASGQAARPARSGANTRSEVHAAVGATPTIAKGALSTASTAVTGSPGPTLPSPPGSHPDQADAQRSLHVEGADAQAAPLASPRSFTPGMSEARRRTASTPRRAVRDLAVWRRRESRTSGSPSVERWVSWMRRTRRRWARIERGVTSRGASTERGSVALRAARWRERSRAGVCRTRRAQAASSSVARWVRPVRMRPRARAGLHTRSQTRSRGHCHQGTATFQL